MNKYRLFILILLSINSFSINALKQKTYHDRINELQNIKNKKIVGSILDDFKDVTNTFTYNYEKDSKHKLTNILKWGVLTYTLDYNPNNNNGTGSSSTTNTASNSTNKVNNTIGISKNLNDFFYNKWDLNKQIAISQYNKNYEMIKSEYFSLIDTYSSLIIKKAEYENSKSVLEKLNSDEKIVETNYKIGKISKIEYENFKLQIEIKKNEIVILNEELNKIVNQLKEKNVVVDLKNLEEFEIKDIEIKDKTKELKDKLNTEKRIAELQYNKFVANNIVPVINVNANYHIEKKSYSVGLSVTKNFDLTGVDIDEAKYNKKYAVNEYDSKLKTAAEQYKEEIREYNLLKTTYKLEMSKEQLAKKELDIAQLKYKLGSIKYNDLLTKINDYYNSMVNVSRAKSKLGAFILKKEI